MSCITPVIYEGAGLWRTLTLISKSERKVLFIPILIPFNSAVLFMRVTLPCFERSTHDSIDKRFDLARMMSILMEGNKSEIHYRWDILSFSISAFSRNMVFYTNEEWFRTSASKVEAINLCYRFRSPRTRYVRFSSSMASASGCVYFDIFKLN